MKKITRNIAGRKIPLRFQLIEGNIDSVVGTIDFKAESIEVDMESSIIKIPYSKISSITTEIGLRQKLFGRAYGAYYNSLNANFNLHDGQTYSVSVRCGMIVSKEHEIVPKSLFPSLETIFNHIYQDYKALVPNNIDKRYFSR